MSSRTTALLAQPKFFERYHRRLPKLALRIVKELLAEDPHLDGNLINDLVVERCELHPLTIGELRSVSLEIEERPYLSSYGVLSDGYHAEAEVLYSGSKALWRAKPNRTFDWGFGGLCPWSRGRGHGSRR